MLAKFEPSHTISLSANIIQDLHIYDNRQRVLHALQSIIQADIDQWSIRRVRWSVLQLGRKAWWPKSQWSANLAAVSQFIIKLWRWWCLRNSIGQMLFMSYVCFASHDGCVTWCMRFIWSILNSRSQPPLSRVTLSTSLSEVCVANYFFNLHSRTNMLL